MSWAECPKKPLRGGNQVDPQRKPFDSLDKVTDMVIDERPNNAGDDRTRVEVIKRRRQQGDPGIVYSVHL
jgi:hypothetical protein